MTTSMEEVAGLLHVIEKSGDHGGQFNNIRQQAVNRLKAIEDEAAEDVAKAKKAAEQKAQADASRLAKAHEAKVDVVAKTEEERLKKEADEKRKVAARASAEALTPGEVEHPDPQPVVPLDESKEPTLIPGLYKPEPTIERKL